MLFGFCAGVTRSIELVTGVVILPQRQTALVAKQAAEVDVLSGGRLRLGIGVGWNTVEFEALGEDFKNRGQRVEEQLEVMRRLWTRELVTSRAGGTTYPTPASGRCPSSSRSPSGWAATARWSFAGRLASPMVGSRSRRFRPGPAAQQTVDRLHGLVREAGRDPAAFGIEGRLALAQVPAEERA